MNNKGISLVTVIVMIIVLIILATVSIPAANRLIFNSKEYTDSQVLESVREALLRKKSEFEAQGQMTPLGESYAGFYQPLIAQDKITCKGWYLLDQADLKSLGVEVQTGRFLVTYKDCRVISMADNEYVEQYLVYRLIEKAREDGEVYGEPLTDSTKTSNGKMYVDKSKTSEVTAYGDGWYRLYASEIAQELENDLALSSLELENYIKNGYLVNYTHFEIKKITNTMSEI